MKNILILLASIFLSISGYSYSWQSYGPQGIKTTNLFFAWDSTDPLLIMSDSGLFMVTNNYTQEWEFFDYPAKEAVDLNGSSILFVAGDGSSSDGIYSLHIESSQIDVVEYCPNPNFIEYDNDLDLYYVGYETGLLKSEDGLNWEEVPFFTGRNCVGMEIFYGHMLVNTLANLSHLFLSEDDGNTWAESTGCPGWITSMAYRGDGKLYGVFPDNSYSSGLWSSEDFGNTWEIEFYTTNLNTCQTATGESLVFVGWSESYEDYEGLALYYPDDPPPGLIFLNETLPDKNINKVNYRLLICCGAVIYVCTENGVFACWDYFVGINENSSSKGSINIVPNPVMDKSTIKFNLTEPVINEFLVYILDCQGIKVDEIIVENTSSQNLEYTWNKGNLPAGIYYLVVRTKNETITEKFIIL